MHSSFIILFFNRKFTIVLFAWLLCIASYAQKFEPLSIDTKFDPAETSDTLVKLFSNSEPPGVIFLVSSDINKKTLFIKTNYTGNYNVRVIDYWGRNSILFQHVTNDMVIDIADFENNIFIINITKEHDNKLISSQVINLKRRLN